MFDKLADNQFKARYLIYDIMQFEVHIEALIVIGRIIILLK